MSSPPVYAANCRHYEGRSPASCSFRIYGCPTPEMPGGMIVAEGTGLTTEEVHAALLDESKRWAHGNGTVVKVTEGPEQK